MTHGPDLGSCYDLKKHPDGIPFPKFIGRVLSVGAMDLHSSQPKSVFDSFDPEGFHFRELPIVVVDLAFNFLCDNDVSAP